MIPAFMFMVQLAANPDVGKRTGIGVGPGREAFWLSLLSAPAILVGALAMKDHGYKTSVWGQNIGVWAVCSMLLFIHGRNARKFQNGSRRAVGMLLICSTLILVALPLFRAGLEGVHRWIVVGGIRLHPGAFAIPLFLGLARFAGREFGARLVDVLALMMGALLIAQPDAAEATGFIAAMLVLVVKRGRGGVSTALVAILGAFMLICAWVRADPLGPVPHVEGIIGLASELSPILGFAAMAALALALLPFFTAEKPFPDSDWAVSAKALGCYFAGKLAATLGGHFPVPLAGYGASEIIGYFIALACILPPREDSASDQGN